MRGGFGIYSQVTEIEKEGMVSSCTRRGSVWEKKKFLKKEWWGIGTICPGRWGVTAPRGIQETSRYGTET